MAYDTPARLGRIGGILFVVLFLRSCFTSPGNLEPASSPQDVLRYFTAPSG